MSDFTHLEKLNVTSNKIIEYIIYQIVDEPVLKIRPATEANKPYFNALLKRSRRMARVVQSGNLSAAHIDQNRDNDRELYPKYVMVGWAGIKDADKKLVDFSVENAADFIKALPNWIFDELRNFATVPTNFADDIEVDLEELGKN